GMVAALQMTALVNVSIGAVAIGIGRNLVAVPPAEPAAAPATEPIPPQFVRRAGLIVALTGAVSMGLEVLASRSLALIFGSSLQAFAIVLMAFILGIGLGSSVVASPKIRHLNRNAVAMGLLLAAACWIGVLVLA